MHIRYSYLLVLSACLFAQLESGPVVRYAREISVTKIATKEGNTTIRLRNEYISPATAWVVECHDAGGARWHWSEKELSLDPKPLAQEKEDEIVVRKRPSFPWQQAGPTPTCDNFRVIAAVYADGTVSGDLSWINAIVDERRTAYRDISKALDILNKAAQDRTDTTGVIKQFVEWRDAESPPAMRSTSKTYGGAFGWGKPDQQASPPRRMPFNRPAVPNLTLSLVQDQEKSIPDTIKTLREWQERLGEIKQVTEAVDAAPSSDMPRRLRTAMPPEPDLIGKLAPDFTIKDVDGHHVALKDFLGKAVMLNFWASWCAPCRSELPQIEALYEALKDKGLVVLAINVNESAETAKKFFAEQGYTFPSLLDPAGEANKRYGPGAIPRTILIDKDGIVRYFHRGYGSRVDLSAELKDKLGLGNTPKGAGPQ